MNTAGLGDWLAAPFGPVVSTEARSQLVRKEEEGRWDHLDPWRCVNGPRQGRSLQGLNTYLGDRSCEDQTRSYEQGPRCGACVPVLVDFFPVHAVLPLGIGV